ncbi:MAG: nitronate monooxygenase, partial [Flavobacterium sp.]
WLEQTLNKNKTLKKWVKMIRYMIGSNAVTKAATEVTYKTVWVAGPTIESTTEITGISQIVSKLCL